MARLEALAVATVVVVLSVAAILLVELLAVGSAVAVEASVLHMTVVRIAATILSATVATLVMIAIVVTIAVLDAVVVVAVLGAVLRAVGLHVRAIALVVQAVVLRVWAVVLRVRAALLLGVRATVLVAIWAAWLVEIWAVRVMTAIHLSIGIAVSSRVEWIVDWVRLSVHHLALVIDSVRVREDDAVRSVEGDRVHLILRRSKHHHGRSGHLLMRSVSLSLRLLKLLILANLGQGARVILRPALRTSTTIPLRR